MECLQVAWRIAPACQRSITRPLQVQHVTSVGAGRPAAAPAITRGPGGWPFKLTAQPPHHQQHWHVEQGWCQHSL